MPIYKDFFVFFAKFYKGAKTKFKISSSRLLK